MDFINWDNYVVLNPNPKLENYARIYDNILSISNFRTFCSSLAASRSKQSECCSSSVISSEDQFF